MHESVRGSLTVVGVGIALGQTTLEAKAHIEQADKVFYLVSNPAAVRWLEQLNSTAESLYGLYASGKERLQTYSEMADRILVAVRARQTVVSAFYGHPGVFADPGHRAIRLARSEGFPARMLPGVSAEDYMFADLAVDPSRCGCQSFEASDFLICGRIFDPTAVLVLWQIGAIGDSDFRFDLAKVRGGLELLLERLLPSYGAEHLVTVYEGTMFAACDSRIIRLPLGKLPEIEVNTISTLYVPPKRPAAPDLSVIRRLGMDQVVRAVGTEVPGQGNTK